MTKKMSMYRNTVSSTGNLNLIGLGYFPILKRQFIKAVSKSHREVLLSGFNHVFLNGFTLNLRSQTQKSEAGLTTCTNLCVEVDQLLWHPCVILRWQEKA